MTLPLIPVAHRPVPLIVLALALAGATTRTTAASPFESSPFGAAVAAARLERDEQDLSRGNRVLSIGSGYDALLVRVHLIRHARTSIDIQTFIWTNDECGRLMIYELIEAARRGVKVRIIADHMFTDQNPDIVAFLATVHPNFQTKHYRPAMSRVRPTFLHTLFASLRFKEVNQRMHNKVMVFDDTILITGGRNFENTYFDHSTELNFRDRDVLVIGPAAQSAARTFEEFWEYEHSVASRDLTDVAATISKGKYKRFPTRATYVFGPYFEDIVHEADDPQLIATRFVSRLQPVQKAVFISDEPGKSRRSVNTIARITRELHATLQRAKTSIVMQTPYLVLSRPARTAFREIQRRNPGLRIRISTNSLASTDNLLAYSANFRLRNDYVEQLNLLVHEFKPQPGSLLRLFPRHSYMVALARAKMSVGQPGRLPFLCMHAKSLVVDDAIAFVGSYNLDPRSENLNTEAGLLVEDEAFARQLRAEIDDDMRPENSWVIARRALPLKLDAVNSLVDGIISLTPFDLWPIQNTSSFDLRPGATPVPPEHPSFYERYVEVGSFPGTDGFFSEKEILTRLFKAVGSPLTPVL